MIGRSYSASHSETSVLAEVRQLRASVRPGGRAMRGYDFAYITVPADSQYASGTTATDLARTFEVNVVAYDPATNTVIGKEALIASGMMLAVAGKRERINLLRTCVRIP